MVLVDVHPEYVLTPEMRYLKERFVEIVTNIILSKFFYRVRLSTGCLIIKGHTLVKKKLVGEVKI